MTKRERWEEIAEEMGSFDMINTSSGYDPCYEMVMADRGDFYSPGEWVKTERACQRIAALESAAMRLVRAVLSGERTPEQDQAAAEVWRLVENESPPSQ